MNCAKMTRTAAAIVAGMASFEPGVRLGGVVLNNVANTRHASMLRQAIEQYTDIPVLGVLPRLRRNPLPERHMGLALNRADESTHALLDQLADLLAEHIVAKKLLYRILS